MSLPGHILDRKVEGTWTGTAHKEWGETCVDCNADATVIVQGETDSFGFEANALCAACHKKSQEPVLGPCDWCKAEDKKRQPTRDHEEGLNGPVYQVCDDCIGRRNMRLAEESAEYESDCEADAEDDYDGMTDRDAAPLFGCACENPSSVDTVCDDCIAILQAQDAEIERERLAKASAFTVEECVYWLLVLEAVAEREMYASAAALLMIERDVAGLQHELEWYLDHAREVNTQYERRICRQYLAVWRIVRESVRAIEREKEAMQRWIER